MDADGGGDFLDLPEAVNAASAGDLIIVRQAGASYSGFTTNKGLTIVGTRGNAIAPCAGPQPCIDGLSRVHDLPADEDFVMRGMRMLGFLGFGEQLLDVDSCDGAVWIEECSVGFLCGFLTCSGDALRVRNSLQTVLTRSSVTGGGSAGFQAPRVLDVLNVDGSVVFALESDLDGHRGLSSGTGPDGSGGPGATVRNGGFLFASGSSFTGGEAGSSGCFGLGQACLSAGRGGDGLVVQGSSDALLLDSTTTAGAGAPGVACIGGSCPSTPDGSPRVGAVEDIPLPARTLRVSPPLVTGPTYRLTVTGQPGELVYSVYAQDAGASYVPLYFGPQLTTGAVQIVFEGTIPAGGVLEKDLPSPPVSIFSRFHRSFVQGLLFDALGNAFLTSGSVLLVHP